MTWKVEEYIAANGSIPYRDWFDDLHVLAGAKVATAVLRMEMGNTSSVKWFGGIDDYRINWERGYRIYLTRDGDKLILLFTGGKKASQKSDIRRAIQLKDEYRARSARLSKAS
ncbi:MAG: type II toxin-antitoxin system RelE/ParE family toxin [Rhodanobacter sp.]